MQKSVRSRTKNKIQTKQTGENKQKFEKFNHRYDVNRNITDHFYLKLRI